MKKVPLCGLRAKLVSAILLITIPVLSVVVMAMGSAASLSTVTSAQQRLASDESSAGNAIEHWERNFVLALQNLRGQPAIVAMNGDEQLPILLQMKKTYEHLESIRVIGADGFSVARSDGTTSASYGEQDWFRSCMLGKPIVRTNIISPTTAQPAVNFALPILNARGIVIGVLSATITLPTMSELLGENSLQNFEQVYVVDDRGYAYAQPHLLSDSPVYDLGNYPPVAQALDGRQGIYSFTDITGAIWISYLGHLSNGWLIITQLPQSVLLAQNIPLMRTAYCIGGIAVGVIALFTWFIASRLVQPLLEITVAANDLARGVWSRRVALRRKDELGLLGDAFNRMAEHLEIGYRHIEDEVKKQTAELKRSNAAMQTAMAAADTANRSKSESPADTSQKIGTSRSRI